jgi:GMP synthase (glutamine-hydrolysing)
MTVVVIQHVAAEGPGRVADALDRAGRTMTVVPTYDRHPVPVGPAGIDGLVVMGGPMGVDDVEQYPHLADEMNLIADCLDAGVPVLGICLGAQLLAAAAGAAVRPGEVLELGWHPVRLSDAALHDHLFGGLARHLTPLHWHRDVPELPSGAVHLASSTLTHNQAFRLGDSAYGLLFHLETDAAAVRAMAQEFAGEVAQAGVDPADLLHDSHTAAIAPAASLVFDRWVALLQR